MGKINTPTTEQVSQVIEGDGTSISPDGSSDNTVTSIQQEFDLSDDFIRLLPLKRFFNISAENTKSNEKLKEILAWGQKKGFKTRSELLGKLKEIQYKLGNLEEEEMLPRVTRYLKLTEVAENTFKDLAALETRTKDGN